MTRYGNAKHLTVFLLEVTFANVNFIESLINNQSYAATKVLLNTNSKKSSFDHCIVKLPT